MAEVKISATQKRILGLYSLQDVETYAHAVEVLEAAGLPGDGMPEGCNWRQVKKMSDDELRAALPAPVAVTEVVEAPVYERETWGDRMRRERDRRRQNAELKAAGYRWEKVQWNAEFDACEEPQDSDFEWRLFGPDGKVTSVAQALKEIGK